MKYHTFIRIKSLTIELITNYKKLNDYISRLYSLFYYNGSKRKTRGKEERVEYLCSGQKKLHKAGEELSTKIYRIWMKRLSEEMMFLHSSSVSYRNYSFLFLGEIGSGKSTLASAMKKKGARVFSDDITPIMYKGDQIVDFPIFPNTKKGKLTLLQRKYQYLFEHYFSKHGNLRRDHLFNMDKNMYNSYSCYAKEFYRAYVPRKDNRKNKTKIALFLNKNKQKSIPGYIRKISFPDSFNKFINSIHMPLEYFTQNLKKIINVYGNIKFYEIYSGSPEEAVDIITSKFR